MTNAIINQTPSNPREGVLKNALIPLGCGRPLLFQYQSVISQSSQENGYWKMLMAKQYAIHPQFKNQNFIVNKGLNIMQRILLCLI